MLFNGFQVNPDNLPLKRPGLYQFTCLVNGKPYVGISQNVAKRNHGPDCSPRKFRNAIRKYGKANFLFEPLAYSVDAQTDWLPFAEAELITTLDAINNGYNIQAASGGVGPYGPEFSTLMKEIWDNTTPEQRTKRTTNSIKALRKWWNTSTPEQRSGLMRNTWAKRTKEERSAITKKIHASWSREELAGLADRLNAVLPFEQRSQRLKDAFAKISPEKLSARSRVGGVALATKLTKEELKEWGRQTSLRNTPEKRRDAGKKRAASLGQARLSEIGYKAADHQTPEQRHEASMKRWITRRANLAAMTPEEQYIARCRANHNLRKSPEERAENIRKGHATRRLNTARRHLIALITLYRGVVRASGSRAGRSTPFDLLRNGEVMDPCR